MKLVDVTFEYRSGQPIIQPISTQIEPGTIVSVIGPNGAGKSTLLKLMTGELKPSTGDVLIDDQSLQTLSRKQRADKIAVVNQQNQLYDDMRVIDIVKMGRLSKHSLLSTIADKEVSHYLEMTGLTAFAERPLSSLSGGQKQRVWIASAIAQDPQYLFLDEPTTYLDVRYQTQLMAMIGRLHQQKNMTIIMILHDINQALKMSDCVWLLNDGRLIASGPTARFYDETLLSQVFETTIRVVNVPGYGQYVLELPEQTAGLDR